MCLGLWLPLLTWGEHGAFVTIKSGCCLICKIFAIKQWRRSINHMQKIWCWLDNFYAFSCSPKDRNIFKIALCLKWDWSLQLSPIKYGNHFDIDGVSYSLQIGYNYRSWKATQCKFGVLSFTEISSVTDFFLLLTILVEWMKTILLE